CPRTVHGTTLCPYTTLFRSQLLKREGVRARHTALDRESPVCKPIGEQTLVDRPIFLMKGRLAGVPWIRRADGGHRRYIGVIVFPSERMSREQQPMCLVGQQIAHPQHVTVGGGLGLGTAGQQHAGRGSHALYKGTAWHPIERLHHLLPQVMARSWRPRPVAITIAT